MVSLRGVSKKGNSQIRKFNRDLGSAKQGRQLYNSIRGGDSISKIQAELRLGGVQVSKLTLERSLFTRYGTSTINRFYSLRALKNKQAMPFGGTVIERLTGTRSIKVKVRGITKSGQIYNFDTYVTVGQDETLDEVLDKLREIYEEDNETNKSPLKNLEFR